MLKSREQEASSLLPFLIRALIPLMRALLSKSHLLIPSHGVRLGFQHGFAGDTNIQYIRECISSRCNLPWCAILCVLIWASQMALEVKNLPANAGDARDVGWIPGLGRSPGGGNGNVSQYSCLEKPMDRGAWWAIVHRVAKSQTRLKPLSTRAR